MIVLVHGAPAFGAVERYVLALADGLDAAALEAALVYPDVPELELFGRSGGSVRSVPLDPLVVAGPTLRLVRRLAKTLSALEPRLVHVSDVWPSALLAARLARVPRVLVTHHTPELPRRDNLAGRIWWHAGWSMRPEVIYTSESDRRTDGRRLTTHVVPLGIDLARFRRPPRKPDTAAPTIGTVGRLAAQKGQETLIEAAPRVLARYPQARFVIVGAGELGTKLRDDARSAGVLDRVTFTGPRADVAELLATFDVFAFPSRFEGLGLAVIEAQTAGVPVVATPVGGVRENVVHGETGLLVAPGEASELADAIVALLDDPVRAEDMAAEAQRRVLDRYSEDDMVARTIGLYNSGIR